MESSGQQDAHLLVAHLFRHQAGRIVASLTRVFGSRYLDLAEDVVQDALIKAVESGHDHDADPIKVKMPYTGLELDLGAFSRNREINRDSSFSVLG